MKQALVAVISAMLVMLLVSDVSAQSETAPQERKPAIILGPPPGAGAPEAPAAEEPEAAPAVEARLPEGELPPVPRVKPQPPEKKKVSAPKPAPTKKAPPKRAPAKKAPARAASSPAPQAKDCDYCYGCESLIPTCRRKWVCGKRYSELLAAGLCRR